MTERCATCRYWQSAVEKDLYGECAAIVEATYARLRALAFIDIELVTGRSSAYAALRTARNFGCVQWEVKEP